MGWELEEDPERCEAEKMRWGSGDKGERAGLRTELWSKQAKQPMKGTETIQEGQRYAGHQGSREESVFNRDPHCRVTKEEGLLRELFWWRGV